TGGCAHANTGGLNAAPAAASPFRSFQLFPCAPNAACDQPIHSSLFPSISVVVFQAIGADGPWAVLEAKSEFMSISMSPGTDLGEGATVYASGLVLDRAHALLGYHVSGDCATGGGTTGFEAANRDAGSDLGGGLQFGAYSRGQIGIQLSAVGKSCDPQPGYVFVTITDAAVDMHTPATGLDPLSGLPPDAGVLGFVAVPATFRFPTAPESLTPPSSTPAPTEAGWTTYTDPMGWTIEVLAAWETQQEMNPRVRFVGDDLAVEITVMAGEGGDDDSSFPLDSSSFLSQAEGGLVGQYQGDAQSYLFAVFKGDGGSLQLSDLSDEQKQVLDHMIASITFPASKLGQGQN